MSAIKTFTHENTVLEMHVDESPSSPREWDNMTKMICFHSRYSLGDKHNYDHRDYNSWAEQKKAIAAKEDAAIILPMYLYDHSGITVSTTPFSCPWDSGQIGWVIVTKEKIRKEYGVKRVTKKVIEQAMKCLSAEMQVYDQYVRGEVYGFKLIENGEETDSCWGFFGSDIKTNGILDHISSEDYKELIEKINAN